MGLSFKGKTLNECLNKASEKLEIPVNEINYTILKESKNIFVKHCEIKVEEKNNENGNRKAEDLEVTENSDKSIKEQEIFDINGNMIILKLNENNRYKLRCDDDLKLTVDNEEYSEGMEVTSKSIIKFEEEIIEGTRDIKISVNDYEAKITTEYTPEIKKKPYCKLYNNVIVIKYSMEKTKNIPLYTRDEILQELKNKNVVYGIIDEAVNEAASGKEVKELTIAKGDKPIDDEEDKIKLYFDNKIVKQQDHDFNGTVDYRNINSIVNVKEGDIIAELIKGKTGKDGTNLLGKVIKRKLKKNKELIARDGCKVEGNKVIATMEGKPSASNGIISVNQVLEVNEDVNMKSGNIKFVGNIIIRKNIAEGMSVEAGNSIEVYGNIEKAKIIAGGDSCIKGSMINSEIHIGTNDSNTQKELRELVKFKESFTILLSYIKEIQEKKLFPDNKIGQVVRILIDSKCRNVQKEAEEIMKFNDNPDNKEIKILLKSRIIGLAASNIKDIYELIEIDETIENRINKIKKLMLKPADLHINYAQDSKINATGNVYIEGKGQYTSVIKALGDIIFTRNAAVSRGGELIASGNIKAKVLGSMAGVSTIVRVPKDKIITADIAYNNTTFYFGERKYTLENPSKNVKAYVDEKGEIEVEKLLL